MTPDRQFEGACARLYIEFFGNFPNDDLRDRVSRALASLLTRQRSFPGDAGGGAGGIVYAVGSGGCGMPDVMNADLEKAFGTKMTMIRKRAAQVRQLLGDDLPIAIPGMTAPAEFTLRNEANAICAYAFRDEPIEDIHVDGRISDEEMKRLMIKACEILAKLLTMKRETPAKYDSFSGDYCRK